LAVKEIKERSASSYFQLLYLNVKELSIQVSNSHYETDFGVSSACGTGNTKIGFLKAYQRLAFKKPIFIMRIAAFRWSFLQTI